ANTLGRSALRSRRGRRRRWPAAAHHTSKPSFVPTSTFGRDPPPRARNQSSAVDCTTASRLVRSPHRPGPTEMDAYERLLGDAMEGNKAFFAREDYVEEAWRIVDPVIKAGTPLYEYELGAQRSERACLAAGWLAQPDSFHAAMKIEVLEDGDAVAQRAAGMIAEAARAAAAACGRFVVAVSGG